MIGQTVSHYKILEKLGEGGMGVVYKAQDTRLDRIVAIKFLPSRSSGSNDTRDRFIQEAKSAAALNHPNILNVYEIDERDDSMFIVMEYVAGSTLADTIGKRKSEAGVPLVQSIAWVTQIAHGLKAAHDKNVIHRDVKPQNLMVTPDKQIKIMDFGLAKMKSKASITKTGTSLGTLSYMSPEQAQGISADHRSDIWSLGIVFYELLTSEVPFKAEHEAGLTYLIVNHEPESPSTLDRRIPQSVDNVVMKMIIKDRERRFQTMKEVLQALDSLNREIAEGGSATSKRKAIAVLPFDNISSDKENEYFGDGLTEELIANLSRLKEMRVVSRTTTMAYKGTKKDIKIIGRELAARYLMEGSVRKFQDDVRITAQLIDVEDDAQLWAGTFKGKLADIFDIQEKVAKEIVDALMVKLSPTEKVVLTKRSTVVPEAFDLNLRARNFLSRMTRNDINAAIQLFQRAIELDVRYAAAYAGLGEAYASQYFNYERNPMWLDKAIEAALKALVYDPTLSEAYASLALAYFNKKSIDEALTAGHRAIELDPNNHIAYWMIGRIYHSTDRDHEAVDYYKKVIALAPDFYSAYGDLQNAYERMGDMENYRDVLRKAIAMYPHYLSKHPEDARGHMFFAIALGQAERFDDAKREAAKALELNPTDPLMYYNAACFYSRIHEKTLAVEALKNAVSSGYENFDWAKRDSDLDNIREEPGYLELMKGK